MKTKQKCAYSKCDNSFMPTKPWQKYCCASHRVLDCNERKQPPNSSEYSEYSKTNYSETNIEILDDVEAEARFPYLSIAGLIRKYPHKSPVFIERLVTACISANFSIELAEKRYLQDDKSVEIPNEVYECYKEILNQLPSIRNQKVHESVLKQALLKKQK